MTKQLLQNINKCGVTFRIKMNEGKGFDFTSLTGGDNLKLLSKLPNYLMESQPIDFANDVKLLWEVIYCYTSFIVLQNFNDLYSILKAKNPPNSDQIHRMVNKSAYKTT